ncbi:hypothetical protein GOODEAATRI_006654 [Goodea atripinnis]|uniref:Uncharacterized protein n=1 Tax=Goodea atripinnis TaxID=208336 RepID=A0ABV0PLQ1_9TELE
MITVVRREQLLSCIWNVGLYRRRDSPGSFSRKRLLCASVMGTDVVTGELLTPPSSAPFPFYYTASSYREIPPLSFCSLPSFSQCSTILPETGREGWMRCMKVIIFQPD